MLKSLMPFTLTMMLMSSCNDQSGQSAATTGGPATTAATPTTPAADSVMRHVVLLKFKDSSTPEQVREVENAFVRLPEEIEEVDHLEWGTNVSPENLAKGYTHSFVLTFRNEADRDAYLPHPAHRAFGEKLTPHLDQVLVIDFWATK